MGNPVKTIRNLLFFLSIVVITAQEDSTTVDSTFYPKKVVAEGSETVAISAIVNTINVDWNRWEMPMINNSECLMQQSVK